MKESIPAEIYESLQIENGNNLIVVKRIIEALMRAKILCHRTRIIFSVWLNTWGEGRKFGEFTTKEICRWTGLDPNRASELIAEMIKRQIFRQRKVGHRRILMFNKYYTQWILTEKIRRRRNVEDVPIDHGLKPHVNEEREKQDMDDRILEIKIKWNQVAEKQHEDGIKGFVGIEDIIRTDKKLDSAISTRVREYPLEMILTAIDNYDRYLRIPKADRVWHQRWRCVEFFARGKDNVARFADWKLVQDNWIRPGGASSKLEDQRLIDKAQAFLRKGIDVDRIRRVMNKLPERLWIQVKMFLVNNHEHGEDLYIRIAEEIRKKEDIHA